MMANIIEQLKTQIHGKKIKIVFPEGQDERIVAAMNQLSKEGLIIPLVVGPVLEQLDPSVKVYDPQSDELKTSMLEAFQARRPGKHSDAEAIQLLEDETYFATMLVYMGLADGLVSGAAHSTGDTVRPALQIIKTKPGISRAFGYFLMIKEDEKYLMGDCAINPNPSSEDLAQFALELYDVAPTYGINPKVALLSFSTNGSADTEETLKVKKAKEIALSQNPAAMIDGEMQFDAAFVPKVGQSKYPGSHVAGQANVFIFPTLDAGNIGYKMVERFGGFDAVGPILAGLNQPVNDLSRGCSIEDVYSLSIITAAQSLKK
jgi:phosphate acetyltransferase